MAPTGVEDSLGGDRGDCSDVAVDVVDVDDTDVSEAEEMLDAADEEGTAAKKIVSAHRSKYIAKGSYFRLP